MPSFARDRQRLDTFDMTTLQTALATANVTVSTRSQRL